MRVLPSTAGWSICLARRLFKGGLQILLCFLALGDWSRRKKERKFKIVEAGISCMSALEKPAQCSPCYGGYWWHCLTFYCGGSRQTIQQGQLIPRAERSQIKRKGLYPPVMIVLIELNIYWISYYRVLNRSRRRRRHTQPPFDLGFWVRRAGKNSC